MLRLSPWHGRKRAPEMTRPPTRPASALPRGLYRSAVYFACTFFQTFRKSAGKRGAAQALCPRFQAYTT